MTAQQPADALTSARCIPPRLTDATVQDTMARSCLGALGYPIAWASSAPQRRARSSSPSRSGPYLPFTTKRRAFVSGG